MEEEKYIELFPGSWLYNAGVIGFIQSLSMINEEKNKTEGLFFVDPHGLVKINLLLFQRLLVNERYFVKEPIQSIYENSTYYKNYLKTVEKEIFPEYVKSLTGIVNGNDQCFICGNKYKIKDEDKAKLIKQGFGRYFTANDSFNLSYYSSLGPSQRQFPNAYWGNNYTSHVCPICSFILIHSQLPQIKLIDGSKVFINTPSFYLTVELNKFLKEVFDKDNTNYKNLLVMSIIEFSIKTKVLLNMWASTEIELIVTKKDGLIEFIDLPYEIISIISNRKIAEILSSIGEFNVLNMVINGKWNEIVELSYRVLKISVKPMIGKEDKDFIYKTFFRYENQELGNLKNLANKLLKLYALIEDRKK